MSECVSLAGPGRPRVWSTCSRWTTLGTERIECDELAARPCQQLHGQRQRDLDLVHLLRSLWLERPFPLRLQDRGQRHTEQDLSTGNGPRLEKRGLQWGVEARLIQAEESRPLTEAMLTLARNTGGESAGETQGEQGSPAPGTKGSSVSLDSPLCLGASLRTGYVSSLWGTLRTGPL